MHTSQFVVLLAGAAASVSAQSSATLLNFLPMEPTETATVVGSNSAATTYAFACPATSKVSAASSAASSKSSAGNIEMTPIPKPTNARRDDIRLLPIPKPTNARRDEIRLLPIPKPSNARRDEIRLLPIPKPTNARRDLPWGQNVDCFPYTIVQGPQTWAVHVAYTEPAFKFNIDATATWKGEFAKATDVAGSMSWGGDLTMFNTQKVFTGAGSEMLKTSYAVPVVSASATPTGSGVSGAASSTGSGAASPTGSGATSGKPASSGTGSPSTPITSGFAASGPLPTGAAAFVGAAAGLLGAALAL